MEATTFEVTHTKNYNPDCDDVIIVTPGVCINKKLLEGELKENVSIFGKLVNVGEARKIAEILTHHIIFTPPWLINDDKKYELYDMVKDPHVAYQVLMLMIDNLN